VKTDFRRRTFKAYACAREFEFGFNLEKVRRATDPRGECVSDEQRVAIEAARLCALLRTGRLVKRCEKGSDVHRPVKMWGSTVANARPWYSCGGVES